MNFKDRTEPVIFAVGGAKGGVGKSMAASNLAVQYAKEGLKVAIVDLDFGAANLHTIFGFSKPTKGLLRFFQKNETDLNQLLAPTNQENLFLLSSGGLIPEMADLDYETKVELVSKIKQISADLIIFDLGAGSSKDMVDFFSIADFKVIVTTPEPTALMNNFEFIKNVIYRALKRLFEKQEDIYPLVINFKENPSMTMSQLIEKVKVIDPWQAELLTNLCQDFDLFVIFNQIRKTEEAKMSFKLKKVCKKYLNVELQNPGFVFYNTEVIASVKKMLPLSMINPKSITSQIFKRMAYYLLSYPIEKSKRENSLLSIAWQYLDCDYKKNSAQEKKNLRVGI